MDKNNGMYKQTRRPQCYFKQDHVIWSLREHHYNANEHCNEKDLRWCEQQYKKKREP